MVHNTRNYWVFGLCPSPGILKNRTFRKPDLFPSSGEGWETPTLLGPLERANLMHSTAYVSIITAKPAVLFRAFSYIPNVLLLLINTGLLMICDSTFKPRVLEAS
jgi:hypothetical protein